MNDRGRMLAFHVPDEEGHAPLRARADWGATFDVDADGYVASFVFHGEAGDRLFRRVGEGDDGELPTLDEILALRDTQGRVAALEARGGTRIRGEVWIAQAGVRGTATILVQGPDRFASHMDFGRFGRIDISTDGERAWSYNPMKGLEELSGDERTQAFLAHPSAVEGDWRHYYDDIRVLRNDTLDDRPVHVLRLKKGSHPGRTFWVDAETGDVLRMNQTTLEGPVRIPVTVDYSDFTEVDGVRVARRAESSNPASGRTVVTFTETETGLDLGEASFVLEDPEAKD